MSAFLPPDRYFDPDYDRLSRYFSKLFILIGRESFQYCILDTESNKFVALADFRLSSSLKSPDSFYAELSKLVQEEDALRKKYPSVVLGLDTRLHTMVPTPLFDAGQIDNYLEFSFETRGTVQAKADHLEAMDAYNVYHIPQPLFDFVRSNYREAVFFHSSSALIHSICHQQKANPKPAVIYLNVREQSIDLASFETSRLVFFNSYSCAAKEDILYYTLYALEQLKLQQDKVNVLITGMMDRDSESYQLMEQYISQVSFAPQLNLWNFSPLLSQLPSHRYQQLYALALCGS